MTSFPSEPARRTAIDHLSAGLSALAGNVPTCVYLTLTQGSGRTSHEDTGSSPR